MAVQWANRLIRHSWPMLMEPALSRLVERKVDAVFQRNKPADVTHLDVTELSFGTEPPELQYMRVLNTTGLPSEGYTLGRDLAISSPNALVVETMVQYESQGSRMKVRRRRWSRDRGHQSI
jgi:hypothetical protein